MAQATTAFLDARKKLHLTPDEATISDIAAVLGGEAALPGARLVFGHRTEIEQLLRDHDRMVRSDKAATPRNDLAIAPASDTLDLTIGQAII